jgi:hypothetical protein
VTDTTPPALRVFDEPTRRVPGRWIAGFAIAWLGIWMAQLTPIQLLLPVQVDAVRGTTGQWQDSVVAFGIISGIAGACAVIAYPLTGALSDRTTSRFGRRRPWILGGAIAFAVSLVILGLQTTYVGVGVFWSLALTGFCVMTAALTATISDQVPVSQRGFVRRSAPSSACCSSRSSSPRSCSATAPSSSATSRWRCCCWSCSSRSCASPTPCCRGSSAPSSPRAP